MSSNDSEEGMASKVHVLPSEGNSLVAADTGKLDGIVEPRAAPAPEAKIKEQNSVPFVKLFHQADRFDLLLMLVGTIGACANGAAFPMFAIVFGQFTDTFGNAGSDSDFMSKVSQIALWFVYIAIATMVAAYLQASMWMWTGSRQTSKLRRMYLSAVLRQDVAYFDTQATTGILLQGLNDDSNAVQLATSDKVGHFIQHTACFLIGYIVAFWRGWDMTLVMVGTLPFLAVVGVMLSRMTSWANSRMSAAYMLASSSAQQSISQIRTVVAYNREEESYQQYASALEGPVKVGIKQGIMSGLCNGFVQAIMYWTYALAFIYGAWRVTQGKYTGGDVLNVLVAALVGGFSMGQAAPVLSTFAKGRVAAYKLYEVIERKPDIDVEDETGLVPEQVQGQLELRDVCFAYPARPDMPVFRQFSLMVPAGKTVALVGSSGSGKSTAVQLIERFYDPAQGVVLLDGIDIRQLKLNWLRSQIGLVSQEPTLFATTIFENIAMGRPGATEEEVRAAAEAANAARFIAHLPLQYNTHVGERGLSLSGGQKQRIAIARAILKNPRIMLLDEATSALDTESERIVQEALERMIVGRTTLVIAHRLSTIKNADIIAVVSKGQVVEQGSHGELIAMQTGAYNTLVRLQMKEEEKTADVVGVAEEPDPDIPLMLAAAEDAMAGLGEVSAAKRKSSVDVPAPHSKELHTKARGSLELGKKLLHLGGKGPHSQEAPAAVGDIETGKPDSSVTLVKVQDDDKDKEKKKKEAASVPFSRLAALNKPEWPFALMGAIGAAALGVVQPSFAFVISSMIDTFYTTAIPEMMSRASFLSWMFFVIGVGCVIAATVMHWGFGVCGQRLALRLRLMLYRSILYKEIGWFDLEENSSGVLTTRLESDASQVRGAVGDTLALILQNLFCLAFGFLIAFAFNWRMALVVLGALPFMVSGSIIYYRTVAGMESGSDKQYGTANQAVSDAFSSIRVIHAYTLKDQVCTLYVSLVSNATKTMLRQSQLTGLAQGYSQFSMFAVYGLIIWFGGLDVDSGRSTFNEMLQAFLAILLAAMGLAQSTIGFPDVGKAKAAIGNVFPIIDRQSKIDASSSEGLVPASADSFRGAIELCNVKFIYPARPSVVVFRNFSLSIPAGKTAALVGESGSGKSTIVGLIERFYDVVEGSVLIDGVDIKQYSLKWLRQHIGIVSQEPLLFATSIMDNIKYGRPNATLEEVEAAAKAANAYDFILSLPDGFNTLVGERGMQLSGGQKQRVAIARAVIKNPRIMLLDEATSALDAKAEREVQEALDKIMVGRTSVVVAHRLSTIRDADLIALVYRGSILEQGTHEQLMALPEGGYSKLVAAQMGGASKR